MLRDHEYCRNCCEELIPFKRGRWYCFPVPCIPLNDGAEPGMRTSQKYIQMDNERKRLIKLEDERAALAERYNQCLVCKFYTLDKDNKNSVCRVCDKESQVPNVCSICGGTKQYNWSNTCTRCYYGEKNRPRVIMTRKVEDDNQRVREQLEKIRIARQNA